MALVRRINEISPTFIDYLDYSGLFSLDESYNDTYNSLNTYRNRKMTDKDKVLYDVDLASDLKSLLARNKDVSFGDPSFRNLIFSFDDADLIRVGKKISSLKIVSLDVVNADFLKSKLM